MAGRGCCSVGVVVFRLQQLYYVVQNPFLMNNALITFLYLRHSFLYFYSVSHYCPSSKGHPFWADTRYILDSKLEEKPKSICNTIPLCKYYIVLYKTCKVACWNKESYRVSNLRQALLWSPIMVWSFGFNLKIDTKHESWDWAVLFFGITFENHSIFGHFRLRWKLKWLLIFGILL